MLALVGVVSVIVLVLCARRQQKKRRLWAHHARPKGAEEAAR
eukprot:gene8666-4509_t